MTSGVIGMEELLAKIRALPGSVVKKVADRWTLDQAQAVARQGRKDAPRDKRTPRRRPETARLWRSIRAKAVRKGLKKFPHSVSRAIAFGASVRDEAGKRYTARRLAAAAKGNRRRTKAPVFGPPAPRAKHFAIVNVGTGPRVQKTTGRRTGSMPANAFFSRSINKTVSAAESDVNRGLADAYSKAVDAHFARMTKRMLG